MDDVQAARTPAHLWIVGFLALLWNAFGCTNYLMSRLHNTDYMRSVAPHIDPEVAFAYSDAMPIWAAFGWGLGVWMGLLGSILLLVRHRWAVPVFGLSLLGALLGLGYQLFVTPPPPGMDGKVVPVIIIAAAAALYYYAHRQKQAGVLR